MSRTEQLKASPPMFRSSLLDRLTRVHPAVPVVIFLPAIVLLFATGVAAALYVEHFDMANATPQTWGEMGWILETNKDMNRAMEAMHGRIVRRYRVYERALNGG